MLLISPQWFFFVIALMATAFCSIPPDYTLLLKEPEKNSSLPKMVNCLNISTLEDQNAETRIKEIFQVHSDFLNEALEHAVLSCSHEIIRSLYKYMNYIEIKKDFLPAHLLLESCGKVKLVREILIAFPTNVAQRTDQWGQNIFHHILRMKALNNIKVAFKVAYVIREKKLLKYPTDFIGNALNERDDHGHTPLDYLVIRNDLQSLKSLLNDSILLNINVGAQAVKYWFILSCQHYSTSIFEWLIFEYKSDLLIKEYRSTMLLWILERNLLDEEKIDQLLDRYLDLAKDPRCYQALDKKYFNLGSKYAHAIFQYSTHFHWQT